jgi:hypothetical protein
MTPNLILRYRICNVNTVHPKRIFSVNTATSSALTEYTAETPYHILYCSLSIKKANIVFPSFYMLCNRIQHRIYIHVKLHPIENTFCSHRLYIGTMSNMLTLPGAEKKVEVQGKTRQYFAGYKIYPPANPGGPKKATL